MEEDKSKNTGERRKSLPRWGIKVGFEGLRVVGANGEESDVVREVQESRVVDAAGNEFELEGGAQAELSAPTTPKKLLGQFAGGFPKGWSRATNQERRRLRQLQELKVVEWRDLPFVGIEFSAIEDIYQQPFAFPHLVRELQEGELADRSHPIYLFQGAQPCWSDAEQTMRNVPYIVAIDCAVPPPDKLVYHTLQLAQHEVIEMRNQPSFARYEWTPYLPRHMRNEAHGLAPPVYILGWSGRGAQFQNLDEAAVHRIEYLHPYIQLPQLLEAQEPAPVTCVDFEWEFEGKKYHLVFDKEIDRLATYIPDFCEDNGLSLEAVEGPLKEALKGAFQAARAREQVAVDAVKEQLANLTPEEEAALRNIKTVKFYPWHPTMDVDPFVNDQINPYFGRATRVSLPTAEEAALLAQEYKEEQEAAENASTPKKRTPKRPRKQEEKEEDEEEKEEDDEKQEQNQERGQQKNDEKKEETKRSKLDDSVVEKRPREEPTAMEPAEIVPEEKPEQTKRIKLDEEEPAPAPVVAAPLVSAGVAPVATPSQPAPASSKFVAGGEPQ